MQNESHVPALDGLRGLAICLVVAFHYVCVPLHHRGALGVLTEGLRFGWCGVDLFFVLSGYLITRRLLECQAGSRDLVGFFRRRVIRLLPLYYGVLGLAVILAGLALPPRVAILFDPQATLLPYFALVQNFSIAAGKLRGPISMGSWALAVVVQAYLAMTFLCLWLSTKRLKLALWTLLFAFPLSRLLLPALGLDPAIAPFVLRADGIMMGALLAMHLKFPAPETRRALTTPLLWRGWAILALGMAGLGALQARVGFIPLLATLGMRGLGYTVVSGFYAASLWLVLQEPDAVLWTVLRSGWLRKLGQLSYAIFLFHQGVNGWVHALAFGASPRFATSNEGLATLLAAVLTVALAAISQRCLETPLLGMSPQTRRKSLLLPSEH